MMRYLYKGRSKAKYSSIMEKDWDNLILLDGCRYDAFEEINDINGRLDHIYSKGSDTEEFLFRNFKDKKYQDAVYVTANPLVNRDVKDSFYKVIPVWLDDWCEEYGTVLPDKMTERVIETDKRYPHKRLIAHYVQPHYPFIGEIGQKEIGPHEGMLARRNYLSDDRVEHTNQLIWNLLREGEVERSTIWRAYLENLELVLEHVKKLVEVLKGKTIISSDHGNLFGERLSPLPFKEYGHPSGIYHEKLIKVPWFIIQGDKRKKIKKDEVKQEREMIKDAISFADI
ncbi:MAG: hypothetical protein ACOCTR_00560 [Candidatus Natronoplasma sp.]